MAAHKFTGQWRSFVIPNATGNPDSNGEIYLRLSEAGQIQPGSNHDGNPVTGNAPAAPAIGGHLRVEEGGQIYEGKLVSEEDTNGDRSMVIIGTFRSGAPGPPPQPGPPPPKDDGVWVVTKP